MKIDKRLTKTTVIAMIVALAIIVLAAGADTWFGIDLGVFKGVIPAVTAAVLAFVAGSQAASVEKKSK